MAERCVTAQDRAAAAKPHWCRSPRSSTYYRC
jgi:hypothetical protein